jgi:protein-tyrosine phosphatase
MVAIFIGRCEQTVKDHYVRGMTDWLGPRGRHGGIDTISLPRSPGGLSLCGKHAIGPDREAAMSHCGATTVVCLVEDYELADRYPDYVAWLRANSGASAVWFPIHDLHAPTLATTEPFIAELIRRLDDGEHLLMHCAAGIGRTGTMAVCVLMELGMPLPDALAHVALQRPMAGPEVGAQRDLVNAWAATRS